MLRFNIAFFTYPSPIGIYHIACLERLLHLIFTLFIKTRKALQLLHVTIAMECSSNIFGLRTSPEPVSWELSQSSYILYLPMFVFPSAMAFVIFRISESHFSLCDLDLHTLAVRGLTASTARRSVIKFVVTLFN